MKRDLLLKANETNAAIDKNCQTTLFIDVDELDIHCVHSILDTQLYTLTRTKMKPLTKEGAWGNVVVLVSIRIKRIPP